MKGAVDTNRVSAPPRYLSRDGEAKRLPVDRRPVLALSPHRYTAGKYARPEA